MISLSIVRQGEKVGLPFHLNFYNIMLTMVLMMVYALKIRRLIVIMTMIMSTKWVMITIVMIVVMMMVMM